MASNIRFYMSGWVSTTALATLRRDDSPIYKRGHHVPRPWGYIRKAHPVTVTAAQRRRREGYHVVTVAFCTGFMQFEWHGPAPVPPSIPLMTSDGLVPVRAQSHRLIHRDGPGRGRDDDRRRVGHGGDGQRRGMSGAQTRPEAPAPNGRIQIRAR